MTKQNTGFTTAHMDVKLHSEIRKEADKNKKSFSEQVREYRDHVIVLEEQVSNLMSENKMLKERSKN